MKFRRNTLIRDALLHGLGGVTSIYVPKRVREIVRYQFRRGLYESGVRFPDARDQELRDKGVELEWRVGVRRREMHARQTLRLDSNILPMMRAS